MQFAILTCALAVFSSTVAAPAGGDAGVDIVARTNSKINQYPKPDW